MTDLTNLRVSLTKHGSHKIADLLKAFPKDQVLDNLWDNYRGIKIDAAQTKKNLSVDLDGNVPELWNKVRQLGDIEVENLVLIAIIFSHYDLIRTMRVAKTSPMKGIVRRREIISGKAYTNFAHVLDELGFAIEHTSEYITYDLSRLFINDQFPVLVRELLVLKLKSAGWDEANDFISECLSLSLNDVFSISETDFKLWMESIPPDPTQSIKFDDDEEKEEREPKQLTFIDGHNPRPQGSVRVKSTSIIKVARLLHNEIQSKLYNFLVEQYGEKSVGSENPLGSGSIDIVVKHNYKLIFYEIKTDRSVRVCIREALSQLLEYSYWPDDKRADQLVIVSPNSPTKQAIRYMQHLRKEFNLPIYYQQFNLDDEQLEEVV